MSPDELAIPDDAAATDPVAPAARRTSAAPEPLPWEEFSRPEYGERAAREIPYQPRPAHHPTDLVFAGPCPRCRHEFVYVWPLEVVRAAAPAGAGTLPVTVRCQCEQPHPNRPDGVDGCGAYWRVEVAAE